MFTPFSSRSTLRHNRAATPTRQLPARQLPTRRLPARYGRRRGVAFVYTALGLTVALMVAAVVVDVGMLYQRKAAMQRAADSAALAGAYTLANSGTINDAFFSAGSMAARPENGGYTSIKNLPNSSSQYVANVGNSKFDVLYPAKDEQGVLHDNWYKVTLSRPEPSLFSGMWPLNRSELGVSASAIALYEKSADLEIKGTGVYGVAPGPVNLSVFGPDGRYSYGDPYSTKRLNPTVKNGKVTPGETNVRYNPNGYDFRIDVPTNQRDTTVEIFDPDCYNVNSLKDATSSNGVAIAIDEMRTSTGQGTSANATTTQYTLSYDNGTLDTRDDIIIGSRSWDGTNTDNSDMNWVEAFKFDRSESRFQVQNGNFHLNVKSTAGSSENGFDLRAGPERKEITTYTDERYIAGYYFEQYYGQRFPYYATRRVETVTPAPYWNPENGTRIVAEGHLPINFNISGVTKMALGKVPPGAGGGQLSITKFDTDINSKNITYTCDKLPGKSWPGTLTTDGTFTTDVIRIPNEYKDLTEAGIWYAEYVAGNQDTSVWDMSYTGNGPGKPGKIRLVR